MEVVHWCRNLVVEVEEERWYRSLEVVGAAGHRCQGAQMMAGAGRAVEERNCRNLGVEEEAAGPCC